MLLSLIVKIVVTINDLLRGYLQFLMLFIFCLLGTGMETGSQTTLTYWL